MNLPNESFDILHLAANLPRSKNVVRNGRKMQPYDHEQYEFCNGTSTLINAGIITTKVG
jgi:hypothetical protein